MSYHNAFNMAVDWVLKLEGVFSDHAADPGGLTKYGITQFAWAIYRNKHPNRSALPASVRNITVKHATDVYHEDYWQAAQCHHIADVSKMVAIETFDAAVNCGVAKGQEFLQKALNYCRYPDWPAIAVDSKVGPITRARLQHFMPRHELTVITAQNGYQFMHYEAIVANNPDRFLHFSRGWMKRVQLYGESPI